MACLHPSTSWTGRGQVYGWATLKWEPRGKEEQTRNFISTQVIYNSPSSYTVPKQGKTSDAVDLSKGITDIAVTYLLSCKPIHDWHSWFLGAFLTTPTTLWCPIQEIDRGEHQRRRSKGESGLCNITILWSPLLFGLLATPVSFQSLYASVIIFGK